MELIDKAKVAAEIKRRITNHNKELQHASEEDFVSSWASDEENQKLALTSLLLFLNTLEVKEVDLEEELKNCLEKENTFINDNSEVRYYNGDSFNHIYEIEFIAKHFFELGLKAGKGEQ